MCFPFKFRIRFVRRTNVQVFQQFTPWNDIYRFELENIFAMLFSFKVRAARRTMLLLEFVLNFRIVKHWSTCTGQIRRKRRSTFCSRTRKVAEIGSPAEILWCAAAMECHRRLEHLLLHLLRELHATHLIPSGATASVWIPSCAQTTLTLLFA